MATKHTHKKIPLGETDLETQFSGGLENIMGNYHCFLHLPTLSCSSAIGQFWRQATGLAGFLVLAGTAVYV